MKNIIKNGLRALLIVPVLALGVTVTAGIVAPSSAFAACDAELNSTSFSDSASAPTATDGAGCSQGAGQQSNLFGTGGIFTIVTNVLLFIIGAISVIMLIIGGIRYTVSGGDSGAVTSAKNTIMYAIVGIIVALLAYALVNFVLTSLGAPAA